MALKLLVKLLVLGLPVTASLNAVVAQRQQWGALGNALKNAASAVVGAVADGLDSLENLFGRAILGDVVVDDFRLRGNDMAERNLKVAVCFSSVALAGLVGWIADRTEHGRRRSAEKATSYFWLSILGISYVLLVPGLFSTLFMFLMGVQVLGLKILVTNVNGEPSQITESALGFIRLLFETGGVLGAALIILYAIVVPVVKLGLLVVAELWRGSEDVAKVRAAQRYIGIVQFISKWACPDMFAYILILYLFKSINVRGGDVLYTPAELGLGFSCFSIFCVGSTFATMAVNVPKLRDEEEEEEDRSPPIAVRWIGLDRLPWVTAVLLITFLGLFLPGLVLPAMGVHLESELLLEPNGPVPQIAKPILDSLGLEEKVNGTVSMMEATKALAWLTLDGELTDIIAVVMMLVFAMLLPLVDMFVLMRITLQMSSTSHGEATPKLMKVTKWLKHICMMDVALMGVIVINFAGAAYSSQGIAFKLMTGIWVLLGAEVVHYFTYYLVHDAASWRTKTA